MKAVQMLLLAFVVPVQAKWGSCSLCTKRAPSMPECLIPGARAARENREVDARLAANAEFFKSHGMGSAFKVPEFEEYDHHKYSLGPKVAAATAVATVGAIAGHEGVQYLATCPPAYVAVGGVVASSLALGAATGNWKPFKKICECGKDLTVAGGAMAVAAGSTLGYMAANIAGEAGTAAGNAAGRKIQSVKTSAGNTARAVKSTVATNASNAAQSVKRRALALPQAIKEGTISAVCCGANCAYNVACFAGRQAMKPVNGLATVVSAVARPLLAAGTAAPKGFASVQGAGFPIVGEPILLGTLLGRNQHLKRD